MVVLQHGTQTGYHKQAQELTREAMNSMYTSMTSCIKPLSYMPPTVDPITRNNQATIPQSSGYLQENGLESYSTDLTVLAFQDTSIS